MKIENQNRKLRDDVECILHYKEWINQKVESIFDVTRILGIVAAGKGADSYLHYTIPNLINQITEMGMLADVVIGLNHGFECKPVWDFLEKTLDIDIVYLYTGEKISSITPSEIFDNTLCVGEPYLLGKNSLQLNKHRIFVIHQREGAYTAGKIRVLGDIYSSLILKSIANGWIPPRFQVAFDAESLFLANQDDIFPQLNSNGLALILNELMTHPDLDILGANNRYVVYRKHVVSGIEVLFPDFDEELPPIQWFLNVLHGQYSGYRYKPAGCTVGKTDILVSLFIAISKKYPGARIDDVHLTILAKFCGFKGEIFMNTASTNRVPSLQDATPNGPAWMEQVYRWSAGLYALEMNYGKHNVRPICSPSFPWSVLINPLTFWKRFGKMEKMNLSNMLRRTITLSIAFIAFTRINKRALENPDTLQGAEARASW